MLVAFTLLIIGVHCIPRSAVAQNVEESVNVMEQEGTYKRILNTELFSVRQFYRLLHDESHLYNRFK